MIVQRELLPIEAGIGPVVVDPCSQVANAALVVDGCESRAVQMSHHEVLHLGVLGGIVAGELVEQLNAVLGAPLLGLRVAVHAVARRQPAGNPPGEVGVNQRVEPLGHLVVEQESRESLPDYFKS